MSINIEIHHIEAALDIKAGYTLGLADAILIHAMARKLLAVMGAQPVVWASVASIDRGDVREVWPNGEQDKAGNLSIAPLFTAPPAPAVPDERYPVGGDKWGWSGEYNRGWNACRAAMLESTPEAAVGTAPAVNIGNMQNTLGWIACSDCMPEENSPVLVCSSSGVVQRAIYSREGDNWNDWHGEYDEVDISAFSHWMPLPAAPTPTNPEVPDA